MDLKGIFNKEKKAANDKAAADAAKRRADEESLKKAYSERIVLETSRLGEVHKILTTDGKSILKQHAIVAEVGWPSDEPNTTMIKYDDIISRGANRHHI